MTLRVFNKSRKRGGEGAFPGALRPTVVPITGSAETIARPGWLYCNGATVNREKYKKLFNRINTDYNTGGEAGTDFRLPDYRGALFSCALDGQAAGGTRMAATRGLRAGEETHALALSETPRHVHDRGSFAITNGGSHNHAHNLTMSANNNTNGPNDPNHALCSWTGGVSTQFGQAIFSGASSNDPHTHPSGEWSGATENGSADGLAGTGHSNVPPTVGVAWMVAF